MRLDRLLDGVATPRVVGDPATEVLDVTHDSRQVSSGSLFCCLPGASVDGHDFAPAAVAAGARALLWERPLALRVAQAIVPDARAAMAPVAAACWGHPSQSLDVVGV